MFRQSVVGVYESLSDARAALEVLDQAGFSQDEVSFVTSNVEKQTDDAEVLEYGDMSADRAAKGAGVGALVGGLLGSPLLMVPGIGPLLMAGPIAAGGVVGGLMGAMAGWGVTPDNIEEYQQLVRKGEVIIVVQGPPDRVVHAHELLNDTSAKQVHLHAKTSTDAPEIDGRPATSED